MSSSNSEHESALAKAREIRDGLSSLGWADPIMTDSGNGAQLMYRIDLPANDGELVRRVIGEIAKASSEQVAIDTSVHNPARIWRLPGTMNCKGDSIPQKIFEINRDHPLLRTMLKLSKADPDDPQLAEMIQSLFDSTLLLDGYIKDPHALASRATKLLEQASAWYADVKKL